MINWEIKKVLQVIFFVQILFLGVNFVNILGLGTPILTQITGFIYLAIIPGILILRIIRFNKLPAIETFLYSVGLSLFFLMLLGLLINFILPLVGISEPISTIYLIITISISVFVLCIINYNRDKNSIYPHSINIKFPSQILIMPIFIVMSIIGTYLMNAYNINILLLALLIITSLMPIWVSFKKNTDELLPLIIFFLSVSLLLHRSLISDHIWGWDSHIEYYFSNMVKLNSIWDPLPPHNINAMLSITLLAPIFSNICNLSLVYTFKIIYPLLFSLVPVALFLIFKKQISDKIAFLSCFFFISLFAFYSEMISVARQQIAEFFVVLLVLLLVSERLEANKRKLLFIIFSFSLTISHYGLSSLYMLALLLVCLLSFLMKKSNLVLLKNYIDSKIISLSNILLFVIFNLSWYIYTSSSSTFNLFINISNWVLRDLFTNLFNPEVVEGLQILATELGPLRQIQKYIHLASQVFIVIGLLSLFFTFFPKKNNKKYNKEYVLFSFVNLSILFACLSLPFFARQLNTIRFYQSSLLFLAPFCVIGGIIIIYLLSKLVRIRWSSESFQSSLKILSVFFAVYLLFNSGLINEVANGAPISISLNNNLDFPRFNTKEIHCASLIADKTRLSPIYGDEYGRLLLHEFAHWRIRTFDNNTETLPHTAYVYFRSLNVNGKIIESYENPDNYVLVKNYNLYNTIITKMNKLYDNGGAQIYARESLTS